VRDRRSFRHSNAVTSRTPRDEFDELDELRDRLGEIAKLTSAEVIGIRLGRDLDQAVVDLLFDVQQLAIPLESKPLPLRRRVV
jgi:hypothetical protein